MKRLLVGFFLACTSLCLVTGPAAAQEGCEGTTGAATIDEVAWTADCVIASTAPDCIDSTGAEYECFAIIGFSSTSGTSISIFLPAVPSQGQSYDLGGIAEGGAMVFGGLDLFTTADEPYTGSVHVSVYDPVNAIIECTFAFRARGLFQGTEMVVSGGSFTGRLVPVEADTWTDVKQRYR